MMRQQGYLQFPLVETGCTISPLILLFIPGKVAAFLILLNHDDMLCTAYGDHDNGDSDHQTATCSAIVDIVEGNSSFLRF